MQRTIQAIFDGKPIYCGLFKGEFFAILYITTDNEQEVYFPCEEDEEVLRPFYEGAISGEYSEHDACGKIASIMRDWSYDI